MTTAASTALRNADADWDQFDPAAYAEHNYATMRADDAQILGIARDWFRQAIPAGARLEGLDVGTGSNLYPAFTLLPHCDEITLWEYSTANAYWIGRQLEDLDELWAPFALLASGYEWRQARIGLPKVARVRQGSIFDLPAWRWEVGTMAFVAESLTGDRGEFEDAVDCFLGALEPGASFAAAFMENSRGYQVAGQSFPAVAVNGNQVLDTLDRLGAEDIVVHRVDIDPKPLRPGYSGYLVATGRTAR